MPKSWKITSWSAAMAVLLTLNGASVARAQGTWTSLDPVSCPSPVPCPTEGMTVGGVGKVIIAAYGNSFFGDTNLTRLYNTSSDSWSLGALAPLPLRAEAAYGENTHGGFFYVIGGRTLIGGILNDLEQYDPVTNTWATLASMPTPRAGSAAAVVDDALYVIGGRTVGGGICSGAVAGLLATVERYDIDTNTWSAVAPLPSPRSDLEAVAHGGKIFVFGGCSAGVIFTGFTNEVDMYDPQTDTWTTLAPMPTPRAGFVAGKSGQRVFAIGGWNGGAALSVNEVYDISHDTWSSATPMPTPRMESGVHSHGGRMYVVGGKLGPGGPQTDANEVFKPNP